MLNKREREREREREMFKQLRMAVHTETVLQVLCKEALSYFSNLFTVKIL
jgi:hypothetical protein